MDCPVCGCRVAPTEFGQLLVECACCGTVWMVTAQTHEVERILVGPEG
jgi:uncharacterized Zn finger protein